jgi:hypothetical protein
LYFLLRMGPPSSVQPRPLGQLRARAGSPRHDGGIRGNLAERHAPDVHARVFDPPAALLAPRIVSGSFEYQTGHALRFTFNKDVRDSLAPGDLVVTNLDTGLPVPSSSFVIDVSGDTLQPTTATWRRTTALPDGNYRAPLAGNAVADAYGNVVAGAGFSFDFFVLAADANRDRKVSFEDLVILAQNYGTAGKRFSQGNFNYDAAGNVGFEDLVLLAQKYNSTLPAPAAVPVSATSESEMISTQSPSKDHVFNSAAPIRKPTPPVKAKRPPHRVRS